MSDNKRYAAYRPCTVIKEKDNDFVQRHKTTIFEVVSIDGRNDLNVVSLDDPDDIWDFYLPWYIITEDRQALEDMIKRIYS